MIFKPDLARAILAGRKTATRRPVKPNEQECRYKPGRSYAIQMGRGKEAVGRFVVVEAQMATLGQFTLEDAKAEGFKTQRDFFDRWMEMYDHIDPSQAVWVITFSLESDPPRLLHKDSSHGYTDKRHDAMHDEPEAIPTALQNAYAEEGRAGVRRDRSAAWQESRSRLVGEIERLRSLDLGAHTVKDIAAIEARVRSLDRKLAA